MTKDERSILLSIGQVASTAMELQMIVAKVVCRRFDLLDQIAAMRAQLNQLGEHPDSAALLSQLDRLVRDSAPQLAQCSQELIDCAARAESATEHFEAALARVTQLWSDESDENS